MVEKVKVCVQQPMEASATRVYTISSTPADASISDIMILLLHAGGVSVRTCQFYLFISYKLPSSEAVSSQYYTWNLA